MSSTDAMNATKATQELLDFIFPRDFARWSTFKERQLLVDTFNLYHETRALYPGSAVHGRASMEKFLCHQLLSLLEKGVGENKETYADLLTRHAYASAQEIKFANDVIVPQPFESAYRTTLFANVRLLSKALLDDAHRPKTLERAL